MLFFFFVSCDNEKTSWLPPRRLRFFPAGFICLFVRGNYLKVMSRNWLHFLAKRRLGQLIQFLSWCGSQSKREKSWKKSWLFFVPEDHTNSVGETWGKNLVRGSGFWDSRCVYMVASLSIWMNCLKMRIEFSCFHGDWTKRWSWLVASPNAVHWRSPFVTRSARSCIRKPTQASCVSFFVSWETARPVSHPPCLLANFRPW